MFKKQFFLFAMLFNFGLLAQAQMAMPEMLSARQQTATAEHVPASVWEQASIGTAHSAESGAELSRHLADPEQVQVRLTISPEAEGPYLDVFLPRPERVTLSLFDRKGKFRRYLYQGLITEPGTVRFRASELYDPRQQTELRVEVGEEMFIPEVPAL